jgi:two-component system, OmpR family, copper resistance phosphate regulon response regulator CusR
MKILVVEDEEKTRAYLRSGLIESGFVVDATRRGDEGLFLAQTENYDLLILDVMLPGKDGWQILSEIRRTGNQVPVLFLTARDTVDDRVKGLAMGADDYLIKPFAFSELLERVRSILRRGPTRQPDVLRIADLEIDLIRRKVMRSGKQIELSPKEFALLAFLARRTGEVLPRTVITEKVWDMNFDSETNVVEVAIRRLRSKLDDSFETKLIHTIRGVGYVLEPR